MRRARLTAAAATICLGLIAGGLGMFDLTLSDPGPAVAAPEYRFTNTGTSTSVVDIDALDTFANFTLEQNAPGCAAPTILIEYLAPYLIGESPTQGPIYAPHSIAHMTWSTACVDHGENIDVDFGYMTGDLSLPPTAEFFSAELLPTPFGGPGISMAIDCDVNAAGIQSSCSVPLGSASTQVDVVLINNGPGTTLAAFNFGVNHGDPSRLVALVATCLSPGLNCNPDFSEATIAGLSWQCAPILSDAFPDSPGDQSYMSCVNGADSPVLGSGVFRIARVTYGIPVSAPAGQIGLALEAVNAYDASVQELMSCRPIVFFSGVCLDAEISLVEVPPGSTPTPTATTVQESPTVAATPPPAGPPIVSLPPESLPSGAVGFVLDCDLFTGGLQSSCTYTTDASFIGIGLVPINLTSIPIRIGAWQVDFLNPDRSRLDPPTISGSVVDSNPDVNDEGLPINITCARPRADRGDAGPSASVSTISCETLDSIPLAASSIGPLITTVYYAIPIGAAAGEVKISLTFGELVDPDIFIIGHCPEVPQDFSAMPCLPATITLIDPPPSVHKVPEGNAANADSSVPRANLWLCEQPAPCAGAGEGSLRVVERAENVKSDYDADGVADATDAQICMNFGPDGDPNTPDDSQCPVPGPLELGLGAYEFTVEYDHFVIASVNPCDLVFGPGGAGSSRGPVEELASSANADCDNPPSPTGSCAMSLILENLVHFGCATNGSAPSNAFGDFDLASLNLVPHEDLSNDLFPGNNNGVLTVVKDNGCELVDVFGHPVSGSVNGGLTPGCGDLAVTVRILEGDLDLDCDVDVTDAQMIAARYGAFFGGLLYSKWLDLEPELHDLDIDIKDIQKVFGRDGSSCQAPMPAQPPLDPPTPFGG